jgi:hypothetical protein
MIHCERHLCFHWTAQISRLFKSVKRQKNGVTEKSVHTWKKTQSNTDLVTLQRPQWQKIHLKN